MLTFESLLFILSYLTKKWSNLKYKQYGENTEYCCNTVANIQYLLLKIDILLPLLG